MKREVAIAAGVLVPFAILVALAFHFSAPEPGPVDAGAIGLAPTPEPVPAEPVAAASEPRQAPAALALDAGAPAPRPAPDWPPALAAPLAALAPEVHRCFADERARLKATVKTKARFTPTRDGGFSDVTLETTAPDPWLRACVEDVFEEVRFAPSGAETFTPAEYTFSFDPSGD